MANEVEICNLALMRLGKGTIEALSEKSREGKLCNKFFPLSRDFCLAEHDWGFARKTESLDLLDETHSKWTYVYAEPLDCIKPREIFNPSKSALDDKISFEIGLSSDSTKKVIFTDQELAELIYTSRVTSATLFDSLFCDALAWRLAFDMSQPLVGAGIQQALWQSYRFSVANAQVSSANTGFEEPKYKNRYVDSRS